MFQISGIIVDKSGRDYSGNMENANGLKTERIFYNTRPSSPLGLSPHCDEGRVLRFTLEVGQP